MKIKLKKILEIITLIEAKQDNYNQYRLVLLQFAAAGGKTAVIIPILAHQFARRGMMPVIMNTTELYGIAIQEIPDSLRRSLHQNVEVIEKELDFHWSYEILERLYDDLNLWLKQGKCLLLTSVTWHSINLAYKKALDGKVHNVTAAAKKVLDFFALQCVKLEDEGI